MWQQRIVKWQRRELQIFKQCRGRVCHFQNRLNDSGVVVLRCEGTTIIRVVPPRYFFFFVPSRAICKRFLRLLHYIFIYLHPATHASFDLPYLTPQPSQQVLTFLYLLKWGKHCFCRSVKKLFLSQRRPWFHIVTSSIRKLQNMNLTADDYFKKLLKSCIPHISVYKNCF